MLSKLPNIKEALLCTPYHLFLSIKADYISQKLSCKHVIKFTQ